jgi:hypothetical protein
VIDATRRREVLSMLQGGEDFTCLIELLLALLFGDCYGIIPFVVFGVTESRCADFRGMIYLASSEKE